MDIEDKKRFKKLYDAKKVRITVSMNQYEKSILDLMMHREGCRNVCGFVKSKLFGQDYTARFNDIIASADGEELKRTLVNIFSHLTDQLDYINSRYEKELEDLKKTTPMVNKKTVSAWVSLLDGWNKAVEIKTNAVLGDLGLILARMRIIDMKKQDYLKRMPDSILDKHVRNWDDTSSPEFIEYTRRMLERTSK